MSLVLSSSIRLSFVLLMIRSSLAYIILSLLWGKAALILGACWFVEPGSKLDWNLGFSSYIFSKGKNSNSQINMRCANSKIAIVFKS